MTDSGSGEAGGSTAGGSDVGGVDAEVRRRFRDRLLTTVDLMATAVFALEGALIGMDARLDVFGVLVIAVVTATAGGVLRDLLIGDVPPASIRNVRYPITALAGGAIAILVGSLITGLTPSWVLTGLDAAGLSLFAVTGTAKAIDAGLVPMMCAVMGALTAVGGGTVRDVLLGVVPAVLRSDIYAVAALFGAAVMLLVAHAGVRRPIAMAIGAVACGALRLAAVAGHWNLPVPHR